MRFKNLTALILAVTLVGCMGDTSGLGTLAISDSDSFSIRARIHSTHWPSRHIYFDRVGSSMAPYSEPIYKSDVTASVTNSGSIAFSVVEQTPEQTSWKVAPGQTIQLPRMAFKDFRITIIPSAESNAEVVFGFNLDRRYSTRGMWRLVEAWSDGP